MTDTARSGPLTAPEREALDHLVRAARQLSAIAAEFADDEPAAMDESLQQLDGALARFWRTVAEARGETIPSREEQLEERCRLLAEGAARVADQHKVFLSLAARSAPGLNVLAMNALTATVPEEGTPAATLCQHWAAKSLAVDLLRTLGDAENFVTMEMPAPGGGSIEVTIRRAEGKTPAQLIREQREQIERLTRERADALDQLAAATADARAAEGA